MAYSLILSRRHAALGLLITPLSLSLGCHETHEVEDGTSPDADSTTAPGVACFSHGWEEAGGRVHLFHVTPASGVGCLQVGLRTPALGTTRFDIETPEGTEVADAAWLDATCEELNEVNGRVPPGTESLPADNATGRMWFEGAGRLGSVQYVMLTLFFPPSSDAVGPRETIQIEGLAIRNRCFEHPTTQP